MIIAFDLEATGLSPQHDQVLELGLRRGRKDLATRVLRFRPTIPIPAEATAVHHLTAQDLAGEQTFAERAAEVAALFDEATFLLAYNGRYDVALLCSQFERVGHRVQLAHLPLIDPLRLWQQMEPRTLADAHARFCGRSYEGAHSAGADVDAMLAVLTGMRSEFKLDSATAADLAALCEPKRRLWIGPSDHFQRREADGEPIVCFGRHRGLLLRDMDEGFLRWVLGKPDFPPHVHRVCALALDFRGDALREVLQREFAGGEVRSC